MTSDAARALADEYDTPEPPDRYVTGGAFVLDEPAVVPSVWGEDDRSIWPEGEGFLICGPTGVGKTTLGQQVLLRRMGVRTGDVLGLPVAVTTDKVLYLASDRPRQIARSLRRMVDPDDRDLLDERLIVWRGPPPGDLAKYPDLLLEMCQQTDARTVFLDSLKDVAIGLANDEVGAGVNRAIQTALAEGVEVGSSHHQRKSDGTTKPKALSDVYGSTWLTAGMGSVVLLWGNPGDAYVDLLHLKQPSADVGPLKLRHDHDAGTTAIVDAIDLVDLARVTAGGIGANEAARAIFDAATPNRNQIETARRRLGKLTSAGELVEVPGSPGGGGTRTPTRWRVPTILDMRDAS